MKVISLWQPFASLIFLGVKQHETRGWRFPTKMQGQRIAIHATAKFTPRSEISPDLHALCLEVFGAGYESSIPRSAILGTVVLVECHEAELRRREASERDIVSGNWDSGRYAWELGDVEKFPMAVMAKGQQGWWSWDPEPEPLTFEILDKK